MLNPFCSKTIQLFLALCLLGSHAVAEEVTVLLPGGLHGVAEYRAGAADGPAVLVLHGFLQTHNFSTVRLIRRELGDAGYTVLSPTLTLNIDMRRNSLTCDAIQNHSVEQANREISAWIDWLKLQGYSRIVLIGHSTGSNHLLSYLHSGGDPTVSALIATSAGPVGNWQQPQETRRQIAAAEKAVNAGKTGLGRYSLGFCVDNYAAPPRDFLSYQQWDPATILSLLKHSPVPTTVILGRVDKWVPPDWAGAIEREAVPLVLINEADHYFSGIGEFDFQATVLSLVEDIAAENGR